MVLGAVCAQVAYAGPTGGEVVGGNGSISHSGLNTTINQSSQNMAINWQSYNVNVDERVQYIQPNSSALSLNRILSNNGSTIAGRIDANGQVILVNPNGIFFTPTSVVNVGGIIASGLDIAPSDFMNGNYIFNEVLNTDGAVINSGTINASLGGNVALIGKQVENSGLIVANLGTVSLAAGKQAVLTFDQGGLLGVRVSEAILQDELGVDPAVMNSGEVQAHGGRVLLSASTSQDVFSQAVNTGEIEQATSVVVHEDGSFTLGGGADVVNTGSIDTSTTSSEQSAGRIVLLGENVTSSGELRADAVIGNGGEIELHAQNTTLLTEHSLASTRSETHGNGGIVKVLGNKVGLFDQARVDVSGANGGGQVLVGGDYQGTNPNIRNANRTTVESETTIYADALAYGNGGRIIVWANEYTRYYGSLFARGGGSGGNGGFAEVSGKDGLIFRAGITDLSAGLGQAGLLLLDPKNITVSTSSTTNGTDFPDDYNGFNDINNQSTNLNNSDLATRLTSASVQLRANNDITIAADVTPSQGGDLLDNNLTLDAGRSIIINNGVSIVLDDADFFATVNHGNANPSHRDSGDAVFSMGTGSSIVTRGGEISISTGSFSGNNIGNFTLYTLNSSVPGPVSGSIAHGGPITITNTVGSINAFDAITATGENPANQTGGNGGAIQITANAGNFILNASGNITTNGGNAGGGSDGGNGGAVTLSANNVELYGAINSNGGNRSGSGSNGNGGAVTINVSSNLTSEANISSARGTGGGSSGTDGAIVFNGNSSANIFNVNNSPTYTGSSVTINGQAGNDRVVRGGASVTDNTWTVTGGNTGTLQFGGNLIALNSVESLVGGALVDTFTINNGASLSGLLDGGTGAADTLTINSTGTTVQLGSRTDTEAVNDPNLNVIGVETITANPTTIASNIIISDNLASNWIVNAVNGGSIAPTVGATAENTTVFSNMGILNGGAAVDAFNISGAFSGAINGGAGADVFTINSNLPATLNGDAGDDTFNISMSVSGNVNGGDDSDTFNILADNVTVTVFGGEGGTDSDRIIGNNSVNNNIWTVSGNDSGTLQNVGTVTFNQIEHLNGNDGVDQFTYSGNLTGVMNGGGGSSDTLTITTDGVTVEIGDRTTANLNVFGIETVTANAGVIDDSIIGDNIDNTWTINGAATSTVAPTTGATAENTVRFINFTQLTGGAFADTFLISSDSGWTINGGDGIDRFDLSSNYSGILNGDAGADIFRILTAGLTIGGAINGGAGNDEVIAANETNYWTISGIDVGSLFVDSARTIQRAAFASIERVTGNLAADEFLIGTAGSISQTLSGGAGANNTLIARDGANEWIITGLDSGALHVDDGGTQFDSPYIGDFLNIQNLVGASGTDRFAIGAGGSNTGTLNGAGGANSLVGRNAANEWDISGVNSGGLYIDNSGTGFGTAYVNLFQNIQAVMGGTAADRFVMGLSGSVNAIDGGNAANNTLVARQGVQNTWTFTGAESGSLAQAGATYVGAFSNIQSFVGGGVGGEWANLASLSTLINVENYFGFTGIIGNGTTSTLLGQNGQTNTWVIQSVIGETGVDTDGVNDGIFTNANGSTRFVDFAVLEGGNAVDNFTIDVTGSVTGEIRGGDTLNNNTLTGRDIDNTWTITANNTGYIDTAVILPVRYVQRFTDIQQINGGTGIDTFNLTGGIVDGLIDGGSNIDAMNISVGGDRIVELGNLANSNLNVYRVENINANSAASNTILGNSAVALNDWNLTGARTGTVSDGFTTTVNFANFDRAQGSVTADDFRVSANFAGVIDGGAGTDSMLITAAGNRTIELGDRANTNLNVFQIETITARIDANNTLLSDSSAAVNTWTISAARGGDVAGGGRTAAFSNIDNVTGGTTTDNFSLDIDSFGGLIDGGNGTDTLAITAAGNRVIELGNRVNANQNVYQVETIIANSASINTLVSDRDAAVNSWTISAARGGLVTGLGTTSFSNIDNVTGAGTTDNFTLDVGNFSGLINGGAGTDSLLVNVAGNRVFELGNRVNANQNVYQIETLTTNASVTNTLIADSSATTNTWTISGSNSGRVVSGGNNTDFTNIHNLSGTAAADSFTISGGAISGVTGVIDGMDGPGVDSLTISAAGDRIVELGNRVNSNLNVYRVESINARSASTNSIIADGNASINTWAVTGNRSGSVSDGVNNTDFSNFDVLTGSNTVDRFIVNTQGTVTTINAGDGNDDVLIEANANVNTVNLGDGDDVFRITGGQVTSSIVGGAGSDSITVEGGSVGSISMGDNDDFFVITAGTIIGDVNGEAGNDTFTRSGGTINGSMIGGLGTDFIVYTGAVDITLGEDIGSFEGVTAQNNNGILRARVGQTTTWAITGDNSGDVTDSGENLNFSGFATLVGGNGVDNFNVTSNGSISGLVSGNGGVDQLNINLAGRTQLGARINFDGGNDPGDAVTIVGPANVYSETYRINQAVAGLTGSFDQLGYTATNAGLEMNYRAVNTVNDTVQVSNLTLNSVNAANTIRLGVNTFGATNSTSAMVDYAPNSKDSMTILAENGADVIIEDNVIVAGTLTVTADALTQTAGTNLTAGTLSLDGVNSAGSETDRINTTVNNLQVNNSGPVYLTETDGVAITQLNTANLLDIQAGGDVTSTAALVSNGSVNLATAANIVLTGANSLHGALNLTGNAINLVNTAATNLGNINAQSMAINSAGNLTDSGVATVTGLATLTSAGTIALDNAANDFNLLNITANSVLLNDIDNIIGGSIAANTVELSTATGVGAPSTPLQTSTANLTINNSTSGTVSIQNNQAMQVSITNMGDIQLQNNGPVTVERLYTNGGNFAVGQIQYTGDVRLISNGNLVSAYTGPGGHDQYSAPDIVAENLYVETIPDNLGSVGRPISIRVNENFTFIGSQGYVFYFGGRPRTVVGAADLVEFTGITGIAGQQLIEIESLGEVDEAIFTEVRNYYHEDVAIMLPADQRMTDGEDEEEKKRREAVN